MNKLIINTNNLISNIKQIKQKLNGKLFCAVVKADAYGHGVENIVPFIDEYVDYYAVANVSEGSVLRYFTCKKILVLGSFLPCEIETAVASDLELSIYSDLSLKWLLGANKGVKIHIKVNTGMNRLGFCVDELDKVKEIIYKNNKLDLVGIYSHIYDIESKSDLDNQKFVFDKAIALFPQKLITHLFASGGIFVEGDYKMVRVGLSMYGYPNFRPVASIESRVAQINILSKGQKVGYGGEYTAKGKEYIATIPLGYYDGVPLLFSAGGYVYIKGKKCPVVGRVCMDMFMCKVDGEVKVGDSVKAFWSAKKWANIKGTHEWEVLTSIKKNRLKVEFR